MVKSGDSSPVGFGVSVLTSYSKVSGWLLILFDELQIGSHVTSVGVVLLVIQSS